MRPVHIGYRDIEEDSGEFEMGEPMEPPPKIGMFDRVMTYLIDHWAVTLAFCVGSFLGTILGLFVKN